MELLIESANPQDIAGQIELLLQNENCNELSLFTLDLLFNQKLILKFESWNTPLHFVYCLEEWRK